MKKLIILSLFVIGMMVTNTISAQALTDSKEYSLLTGYNDSVVATGTKYLTANLDGDVVGGSIVVVATKSFGNARCKFTLQVSNDNTNWFDVTNGVSHTLGDNTVVDSITNTAGAQYKVFPISSYCSNFKYIRVKCQGFGTSNRVLLAGSYIHRQKRVGAVTPRYNPAAEFAYIYDPKHYLKGGLDYGC